MWITGFDHRIETHSLGARDLTTSPSTAKAAEVAGVAAGKVDVAEIHAPFAHQELIVAEALGLDDSVVINPSGGALAANPLMSAGLIRIGEAAERIRAGQADRAVAHATSGPCLQQNLVCVLEGGVMAERCAVIGVGQTHHKAKRDDVSIAGLVREAAKMALADADLTWSDIDAVVIGKAPDMFEGNMMPEIYLAPALGAVGKPMFRVHTAGSVGGSTALVAAHLISSGIHKRVLTVAYEKQSDSDAMWALSVPAAVRRAAAGRGRRVLRPAHPGLHAPLGRARPHRPDGGGQGPQERHAQPVRPPPPGRHRHEDGRGLDDAVGPAPLPRGLPVVGRRGGHGAGRRRTRCRAHYPPAWVHGMAMRSEPTMFAGRDQINPQAGRDCSADVYAQAGVTDPREQFDCAEVYVPFSWYEPMWLENLGFCDLGDGWKLTESGATAFDGDIPWNASGGVLSSNPIGASGMLRFLEVAMQVRGQAGEHQVDGARLALGQAYGGGSQFFSMWVVGSEQP